MTSALQSIAVKFSPSWGLTVPEKTTTINLITKRLAKDSGKIIVKGQNVDANPHILTVIGVATQEKTAMGTTDLWGTTALYGPDVLHDY